MMSLWQLFQPQTSVWILQSLAHLLWQGTLLAVIVALLAMVLKRHSASLRYVVYCTGLAATIVCLPLNLWWTRDAIGPPFRSGFTATMEAELQTNRSLSAAPSSLAGFAAGTPTDPASPPEIHPLSVAEDEAEISISQVGGLLSKTARWWLGLYLIGALVMFRRLLIGLVGCGRLRSIARPVDDGRVAQVMRRATDELGLRLAPMVSHCVRVSGPVVVGVIKPMILLPPAILAELTPAQIESLLLHELAHIRRYDHWVNLIQRVIEAVLFFHPAVWWMSHCVRVEREHCCDDLAIRWGSPPCDYAESLVIASEFRQRQADADATELAMLAATQRQPSKLEGRVFRILGMPLPGPGVRLTRSGALSLLLVGLVSAGLLAARPDESRDESSDEPLVDLADFDFENPPSGYEHGIQATDSQGRIKLGGISFQAAPLEWSDWNHRKALHLNLGVAGNYEIVELRLFDHANRKLIHTSAWQHPGDHEQAFLIERIGTTNLVRIAETTGTFPAKIDVWLRIAVNRPGKTIVLNAKQGATARLGESEIIVTSLWPGIMSGTGGGRERGMVWDLASAQDKDRTTTVDLQNRGQLLEGRYHVVAVSKQDTRHPLDHTHFRDFSNEPNTYVLLDVPLENLAHLELVPFGDRHKFFFSGLAVPPRDDNSKVSQTAASQSNGVGNDRPSDAAARQRFLQVEQFVRQPLAVQAEGFDRFYHSISWRTVNPFVEGILSSYPHSLLDRSNAKPYDGGTKVWAKELEAATGRWSAEQVADKLSMRLWLDVATRARILQLLERNEAATKRLVGDDLKSGDAEAVQRATTLIDSLKLTDFTDQLMDLWLADNGTESEAAHRALIFLRDPATKQPLLDRVKQDPRFLTRCSGLLQVQLVGTEADPNLVPLLESSDADVRFHALDALQECRDRKLAAPLIRLATDSEARIRTLVARMIGKLPREAMVRVPPEWLELLEDPDEEVRITAVQSFAEQKELSAGPLILQALGNEQLKVTFQHRVFQSLRSLTGKTFDYDFHHWGSGSQRNREAIERFRKWMDLASGNAVKAFGQAPLKVVSHVVIGKQNVRWDRLQPQSEHAKILFRWHQAILDYDRFASSSDGADVEAMEEHGRALREIYAEARKIGWTDSSKLPEIWVETPAGSRSYEVHPKVQLIGVETGAIIYQRPDLNKFWIQRDPLASSWMTYFGPFDGDPTEVLVGNDLPTDEDLAGEPAKFDKLTIAMRGMSAKNQRIVIQGDGTYRYRIVSNALVEQELHVADYRLNEGHRKALEGLLESTQWLSAPPQSDAPPITDATSYVLTLERNGKTIQANVDGQPNEIYQPLVHFIWQLDRQEMLFYRAGIEAEKSMAAHELLSDLKGLQNEPNWVPPYTPLLDYGRLLARYAPVLDEPDQFPDVQVKAAIRLVRQLKDESYLDQLKAMTEHDTYSVRGLVAETIVAFEGERAIPVLRTMLADSTDACWELVKLGPPAVPVIVDLIKEASEVDQLGQRKTLMAEKVVRAYLDHWGEFTGPIDSRVIEAAKQFVAKQQGTGIRREYYQQLIEQAGRRE